MWKALAIAIWVLLLVTLAACGGPEPDVVHGPARTAAVPTQGGPTSTAVAQPTPVAGLTPIAVPALTTGDVPTPSPTITESLLPFLGQPKLPLQLRDPRLPLGPRQWPCPLRA